MRRRLLRDERGSTVAEFAMVSPIVIMLILGIVAGKKVSSTLRRRD